MFQDSANGNQYLDMDTATPRQSTSFMGDLMTTPVRQNQPFTVRNRRSDPLPTSLPSTTPTGPPEMASQRFYNVAAQQHRRPMQRTENFPMPETNQLPYSQDYLATVNRILEGQSKLIQDVNALKQAHADEVQRHQHMRTQKATRTTNVTTEISDQLKNLYKISEQKFDVMIGSSQTAGNIVIKEHYIDELVKAGHSRKEAKAAVQRKYENERRQKMNNDNPRLKEKTEKYIIMNSRKSRTLAKRRRVMVRTDAEKAFWARVTPELMSEEEDGANEKAVYLSSPKWRSQQLNEDILESDRRIEEIGLRKKDSYKRIRQENLSDAPLPKRHYADDLVLKEN